MCADSADCASTTKLIQKLQINGKVARTNKLFVPQNHISFYHKDENITG